MQRIVKSGAGWRIGWNPEAAEYVGLVGGEDWAIELTSAEFDDFCRLTEQLATTMAQMREMLMDQETIACEAESDRLWMEAEGFPDVYTLRFILQTGRRGEGHWSAGAVPELLQAVRSLQVF